MIKPIIHATSVAVAICVVSNVVAQEAPGISGPTSEAESKTDSPEKTSIRPQDLVIVIGSGGLSEYEQQFSEWGSRLSIAAERAGVSSTLIGHPAVTGDTAPTGTDSDGTMADRDHLLLTLSQLTEYATSEPLWIVYIGHGTFDGRESLLNLRGADASDRQISAALKDSRRPVAVILCSSCSSPFVNSLSGPDRVIVSATKDGNQVQFTRFGDAFTRAIDSPDADINRDGQTSLLEAWLFASRRTADFYRTEGRLATEHSLLDDNGDQRGTRAENFDGDRLKEEVKNSAEMDGRLAARWALVRSEDERKLTPEQRSQRDDLEAQIEILRRRRDSMTEDAYLSALESLLRPLADIYRAAEQGNGRAAESESR